MGQTVLFQATLGQNLALTTSTSRCGQGKKRHFVFLAITVGLQKTLPTDSGAHELSGGVSGGLCSHPEQYEYTEQNKSSFGFPDSKESHSRRNLWCYERNGDFQLCVGVTSQNVTTTFFSIKKKR